MSELVLEDRAGTKVLLTKSMVGVFVRVAVEDGTGFTAELDPNQAAILHAKLGEMLGASAEEKFADRVDRLEMAISSLREAVAKLAPQVALDALAEAFTAEMAKVKVRLDPVLIALAKAPLDDLPESDEERAAVADAKRGETSSSRPVVNAPTTRRALTFAVYRDGRRSRVETTSMAVIKIGRDERSTIQIDDERVGRMHAVIEVDRVGMTLIDLGSEIGTRVGGRRIGKQPIGLGDVIEIGNHKLVLERIEGIQS